MANQKMVQGGKKNPSPRVPQPMGNPQKRAPKPTGAPSSAPPTPGATSPMRAPPGCKIIICMPGASLTVPYQEFCTPSTEPAHRYQNHMLTSPYSLFRNWLIENEGSYWLLQILWFGTVLFEINYI